MTRLPLPTGNGDCWNSIGVHGDRSCPELEKHVHCHNCPVFAAAGRRFLAAPSPPGYLEEWTERLASDLAEVATDVTSVLVFRIADEWLALRVQTLVEVTTPRPVHRVPYRTGLLAGLVNIRGELHLCMHIARLLGIAAAPVAHDARKERLLVVRREAESWVFPVDLVDRVCPVAARELSPLPATLARASAHMSCGVFSRDGRTIGLLDETKLFESLRKKLR
jgi:chemotaxis-related protein WspD